MKKWIGVSLLLLLVACASQQRLTAYDTAALAYVQSSIVYEAAMPQLVSLRAQHRITDAQWKQIDSAQYRIAALAKTVLSGLEVWKQTGVKPYSFDSNLSSLANEIEPIAQSARTGGMQ